MKQRIFSLFTALCLCLSLLPTAVFAANDGGSTAPHSDTDSTGYYEIGGDTVLTGTEQVKAMIDALPDMSELKGMSKDELNEVHDRAQDAYDAFEALTDEQQAELTAELAKLRDVLEYMTGQTENIDADTVAKTPERKANYSDGTNFIGDCIFANGTAITIESATDGTRVWYMDGSTKKYVTNNEENGEDLSSWKIFVGSTNLDGMRGVNGSVTMTGGTVNKIYAGQVSGYFRGTSNITIIGGTVTGEIYCNARYGTSATTDYVGTVTIFDAVGTTINTRGGGRADNVVKKKDGAWSVSGNGVIPSGVTLTVNSGETLTVPKDATLTNNGTLINNGTMNLYGPVRGSTFTNSGAVNCYAAYISGVSSAGEISANMDGSTHNLQSGDTYLQNGKLYIWLPSGNAKVTLNGTAYYGVTKAGEQTELTSSYADMSKVTISGMPTEMRANTNITLSAKLTGDTTLTPTISYELGTTTAQGATLNGSTLYAAGAGKVTVKVKVSDGYTTKTETFDITVKHTPVTGLSAEIPASMIVNSKISLPTVRPSDASYQTITWSIISGNDTGATVSNGVLTATKTGTFTIRATVENGTAYGSAYTKDFTVKVTAVNEDSSLDISAASITISQDSAGTLKVEYGGYGGEGYKNFNASESIVITGTTNTNRVIVKSGSPNVVLSDCTISLSSAGSSPFEIQSGATVNLTLSGTNTLKGAGSANDTSNKAPGISVPSGATVKIGGTGVLYATGGFYSAGIGGGVNQSVGTIIINGGTVIAQGGRQAAGIGGGYNQSGGTITIAGGTVTAIGGQSGAGIGGGYQGSGGTVKITGGNVKAQKAQDSSANEIGSGAYGSGGTLTDGNGNSVSKVTFTLDGVTQETVVTAIEVEGSTYGVSSVSTLDTGKLYFYLPSDTKITSVTTANGKYICNGNNTFYKNHEYNGSCDTNCSRCGAERDVTEAHHYENGFCTKCGGYQSAVWNSSKNYYEISNAGQLYWFAALTNGTLNDGTTQNNSANAVLKEDITVNTGVIVNGSLASDTSNFLSWTPIGDWVNNGNKRYSGTFDGNGHTVSGLYAKPNTRLLGFFGETDGSIKNLTVSDSYFECPGNNAGGVVGYLDNGGTIENCFLVNSIVRGVEYVGGIVGVKASAGGTIKKCASINCNISGSRIVGGIVGNLSNGTIIDCYSTSNITASSEYCGGIAGIAQNASTIQNCYFAGQNNCNSYNGAITTVQNNSANKITVQDCYYDSNASCSGGVVKVGNSCTVTTTNVDSVAADRFKTGEIAYLLNGSKSDGVWKQTIGKDSYPNFTGLKVLYDASKTPQYFNDISFTIDDVPATAENAITVFSDLTYGKAWDEYISVKDGITAKVGGTTDVTGTYTIVPENGKLTDRPAVGTRNYKVTFTSADNSYTNIEVFSGCITVTAKEVTVSAGSYKVSKVYDGTTNAGTASGDLTISGILTGDDVTVTATPEAYTNADVGGQERVNVTLTLDGNDKGNYTLKSSTVSVPCEITKATLTVDGTVSATAPYGTMVKNISISGLTVKLNGNPVTGKWSFGNIETVLNVGDNTPYTATFTPESDAGNYEPLTEEITPVITKVDPTAPTDLKGIKDKELSSVKLPDGWTWDTPDTVMGEEGEKKFAASYAGDNNHNAQSNVMLKVNVVAKEQKSLTVTMEGWTYGGTENKPSYTPPAAAETTVTILYKGRNGTTYEESNNVPPNAGDYTVTVTYETENEVYTGTAEFTIAKATLTGISVEQVGTLTYTGSAQTPQVKTTVPDGLTVTFTYCTQDDGTYGSIPKIPGAGRHLVYYKADAANYETYSGHFDVIIDKATPTITNATATVTYGKAVKSSDINATTNVAGSFEWNVTSYGDATNGTPKTLTAIFTPTDEKNYNSVTVDVSVTVNKADLPTSEYPSGLTGTKGNKLSTVKLHDGWTWDVPNTVMDTTGDQTFAASYAGTNNYNAANGVNLKVNVSDKNPQIITANDLSATYGETGKKITAMADGDGTISYVVKSGSEDILSVDPDTGILTFKKAGTATVTVSVSETATCAANSKDVTVTVNKAALTVTAISKSIKVNNTVPDLSNPVEKEHYTVKGLVSGDTLSVTMEYRKDGSAVTPDATKAGSYEIAITATADTEKYEVTNTSGTLTISKPSSGNSGGGGGSSSTTITVPVTSDHATVEVKAEVSKGNATVEVSDKQIEKVIADHAGEVTIDVSDLKNVESATVPSHVVEKTNDAENTGLTVSLPTGSVSLDETALDAVSKGKDVTISMKTVSESALTTAQKTAIGEQVSVAVVVDVNIVMGTVKQSSFNGGKLTISVPYTPKKGEDTGKLTVWFIRDDGTIENKGGYYDAKNKCFVFETDHLSQYILVNTNDMQTFEDVPADAYFANAVSWAAGKGITGGVDATHFMPHNACTRAQIVTFLWRAAGSPEPKAVSSFTDVPENAYYAKAVAWAVENGITGGIGNNRFAPDMTCTRAQAAAFLFRYAVANGMEAVTLQELVGGYGDASQVPSYAIPAFNWALAQGIVNGYNGNLMPNNDCTRAQIVTMLYRMLGK